MRRAAWLVLSLVATLPLSLHAQESPRLGLRLDARASIQWSADTLMLQNNSAIYYQLPVDTILDVWLGPDRGAFAVVSNKGLGMLLAQTLSPSTQPFGPRAILRSSRPDVIWACIDSKDGLPHRRIIERRARDRQRDLLVAPSELLDFDVDVAGHLVMLTRDRRLLVATGTTFSEIALSGSGAPPVQMQLTRVFVDDKGSEVAILGDNALFRFAPATRQWTSTPVNLQVDALVRHAASRRIRVEPKFVIPRS